MKRLVGIVLVLAACGSPPEARAPQADGTIVFFDIDGRKLPFPMVRGTIAGRPTNIVVDTGAQITVVADWLAKRASIPTTASADAQDPAGNPLPMLRAEHVAFTIDAFGPLPDAPVTVIELPPMFEKLDIGAIVSPQTIAPVVIDLPRRRLTHGPASPPNRGVRLDKVRLCPYEGHGLTAKSLVGDAVVDGSR